MSTPGPAPVHRRRPPRLQRGAVLIVGLVMLLLVTLAAVAAMRLSTSHVRVTANEQFRAEATAVANYALDLALNNPRLTDPGQLTAPGALSLQQPQPQPGAEGAALSASYTAPACLRRRVLRNAELVTKDANGQEVLRRPGEEACLRGLASMGITLVNDDMPEEGGNSMCSTSLWELGATVSDTLSGASVTVNQGVEVRMESSEADNKCS